MYGVKHIFPIAHGQLTLSDHNGYAFSLRKVDPESRDFVAKVPSVLLEQLLQSIVVLFNRTDQ